MNHECGDEAIFWIYKDADGWYLDVEAPGYGLSDSINFGVKIKYCPYCGQKLDPQP